jgi:type 1 glutamine amidotransferase
MFKITALKVALSLSVLAFFGFPLLYLTLCACGPSESPYGKIASEVSAQGRPRILYITQSKGFKHGVLPESEKIMQDLAGKNGFELTGSQEAEKVITPENLKSLDVIIFYTTGELPLTDEQKMAFLNFVKSGKAFIGIHSATDTFYQWPEYGEMIGGYFNKHPWTSRDTVTIKTTDRRFPVTKHWEESFKLTEEIYQFKNFNAEKVKVTMWLDTANTDMTKKGIEVKEFPISWYRSYGKGRVFYTALGHNPEVWRDQRYQTMIVNAIKWASGQMK